MTHLDLFSGIGGFSLAFDNIFHEQKNKHIFVEWDDFCQEVLKKHWPEAEIYGDIDKFVADSREQKSRGVSGGEWEKIPEIGKVDFLTGGFPCQPFSQAGRRKGTSDDRYKWPSMLECITLFRPEWVIAENVAGLASWNDGLVLETVCSDLEKEGYEVQPFVIPACAVGAPHRRDRVWIIANISSERLEGSNRTRRNGRTESNINVKNSISERGRGRLESDRQVLERQSPETKNERPDWTKHWFEVATRLCRVDDGVSRIVDRDRLIEYIGKYDHQKRLEILKKDTEGNPIETMRLLRVYIRIAETSLQRSQTVEQGSSSLPEMSHKGGHGIRAVGGWKKEKEKMQYLRTLVSAQESCETGKNLLKEMPLDIREAQRIVAVVSQRNARLKALGNAIVPQVAEKIFGQIKLISLQDKK